jgi:putative phage-type endonuclease
MKTLTLQQGSEAWLAHRRTTRNASDAPAMMGASPYVSRAELVRRVATGIEREVDDATQARFDRGHAVEPALRALAEKIIDEDLYPVTGVSDDGYLGASFDGVNLDETIILEAKQSNAEKLACIEREEIPPQDRWQIIHQFAVCESAETCLYVVGDGTEDGTGVLTIRREDIAHDIPKLIAGWRQFDADVAAYQPEPAAAPAAVGIAPGALPALRIELTGMVTESNLLQFKDAAIAVFNGISTDLATDQDFADAEQTVKWCKDIEDRLAAAKQHALSQTASIDELFRAIDEIKETARQKRLQLDKLVSRRKDEVRAEIVQRGYDAVLAHYRTINASLGEHALQPPGTLRSDLAQAIKGKKTISSLNDAIDSAVAAEKIEASQTAERVRQNIAIITGFMETADIFHDRRQLVAGKEPEDLRNLCAARIAEHQQREHERLERERERIRQEEADRLAREQREAEQRQQAEQTTTGAEASAAAEPVATAPKPVAPVAKAGAAPMPAGDPISLGQIKEWIAPLSIDAAGLASLGFRPASTKGAAKLYAAEDFPHICGALARLIAEAPARAAQKKAA